MTRRAKAPELHAERQYVRLFRTVSSPHELGSDYCPRSTAKPGRLRIYGFTEGAASVADPWASFFERSEPWGIRSGSFLRDRKCLAVDARRAWSTLVEDAEEEQGRLFDVEATDEH